MNSGVSPIMVCQAGASWVGVIYSNIGRISIVVGVFSALAHVVYYWIKSKPLALNVTVGKMLSGFMIPPAVAMGFSALDPSKFLMCVEDLGIYIVVGAFSVFWIALSILFPGGINMTWLQKPPPPESG
jgi:hypothetical protein